MKTHHWKNSFYKVPGWDDVNVQDVGEWFDEIVQFMLDNFTEEPEEKISFDTAYVALQTSLSFLEKQSDVTLYTSGTTSQQKKKKVH